MKEELKIIRHCKSQGVNDEKKSENGIELENFSGIDEKSEDDAKETSSKKAESQQNDLEVSTNNNDLERIEFGKYVFILGEDAETDKDLRSLIWYLKHEGTHF
jgi:hypothetical protein